MQLLVSPRLRPPNSGPPLRIYTLPQHRMSPANWTTCRVLDQPISTLEICDRCLGLCASHRHSRWHCCITPRGRYARAENVARARSQFISDEDVNARKMLGLRATYIPAFGCSSVIMIPRRGPVSRKACYDPSLLRNPLMRNFLSDHCTRNVSSLMACFYLVIINNVPVLWIVSTDAVFQDSTDGLQLRSSSP